MKISRYLINRSGTPKPKTCIDTSTEKMYRCNAAQICCGSECCEDEYLNTILWMSGGLILTVLIVMICWYIVRWCRKVTICVKQKEMTWMNAAVRPFKDCMVKKKEDGDGNHVCTKTNVSTADISPVYSLITTSKYRPESIKTRSVDKKPLLDYCVRDETSPRLVPQSSQI